MFFLIPIGLYLFTYIFAALAPALFLMRYIYRKDTVEPEPRELLVSLLVHGVMAALLSIVLESAGGALLDRLYTGDNMRTYIFLLAFLVVAAVEEGTKLLMLRRRTWREPNFNYRFDGIVYAVFVSLGFAGFENLQYVFSYGLGTAFVRAFLSVPGHMGFAVVMGTFYGRAKLLDNAGEPSLAGSTMLTGYFLSVMLHGFYDYCALLQSGTSMIAFIIFVIIMYIYIFRLIKRESATDEPIS